MILSLSQQRPPAVACGSIPVTSALPFQPPPPSILLAGSSMWYTTILQRHGEKNDLKAVRRLISLQMLYFAVCTVDSRSEISHLLSGIGT